MAKVYIIVCCLLMSFLIDLAASQYGCNTNLHNIV